MVSETEEPRTEVEAEEQEQEGGPVKPFLDHLEDLRWVLIKSLAALGVAIVVCLLAGDKVVWVLMRPLKHTKVRVTPGVQTVDFRVGTNRMGSFTLPLTPEAPTAFGTNRQVAFQLLPVTVGTNVLLGMRPEPLPPEGVRRALDIPVVNLGPASGFIVAFKVAIYAGVVVAAPFIFYFVIGYVFPALRLKEKKYASHGLFFGLGLFLLGVSFCYFILMPVALVASVQYSEWLGFSAPQWRAEEYISFVSKFMLGMGIGFELPVVVLTLVKIGVLNYRSLSSGRRYVIVINFILGAVLTTPEVITQVLMAIPLQVLYEICIWIAWYWERKERKLKEALEAAERAEAGSVKREA